MTDSEGHRRRAAGQALLDELADDFIGREGVDRAAMFGSSALRVHGKIFAFVATDGELVIKLPATQAAALVAAGDAATVKIGRNPAREWIAVAMPREQDHGSWPDLLAGSYEHVRSESAS